MSEAHAGQMMYLLGFVGFLLAVIIGVIILSQFKKKNNLSEELRPPPPPERDYNETIPSTYVHELLKDISVQVDRPVALEIDLKTALRKTEEKLFWSYS